VMGTLRLTVGCAELAKRIDREMMRFAYMDVGEGREQDAEASYLSTSYNFIKQV